MRQTAEMTCPKWLGRWGLVEMEQRRPEYWRAVEKPRWHQCSGEGIRGARETQLHASELSCALRMGPVAKPHTCPTRGP